MKEEGKGVVMRKGRCSGKGWPLCGKKLNSCVETKKKFSYQGEEEDNTMEKGVEMGEASVRLGGQLHGKQM